MKTTSLITANEYDASTTNGISMAFLLMAMFFAISSGAQELNLAYSQEETFTIVEQKPEFEGGMEAFHQYIQGEIRYPLSARSLGIEGELLAEFMISKDGSVTDVNIVSGLHKDIDHEVMRTLTSSPAFTPAQQRGKKIKTRMEIPINFQIQKAKLNADKSPQGKIIVGNAKIKKGLLNVKSSYWDGHWSGTVTDEDDNAIPGANIVVVGTMNGTVSDMDGNFTVQASPTDRIHISFIGYETQELIGSE